MFVLVFLVGKKSLSSYMSLRKNKHIMGRITRQVVYGCIVGYDQTLVFSYFLHPRILSDPQFCVPAKITNIFFNLQQGNCTILMHHLA